MSRSEPRTSNPKIVVVGSINLDLVFSCESLPSPGQTVMARSFRQEFGGKGANQAVAAQRAGGQVTLVGRVGDDSYGTELLGNLEREAIDISTVYMTPSVPSGLAMVAVESTGENSIIVVPGANAKLTPEDVSRDRDSIATAQCLLLQLEVPIETVIEAARIAKRSGVRVILDPAPAPDRLPPELWNVDLLTPNETEAAKLLGLKQLPENPFETAEALRARGPGAVCLTLGPQGTVVCDSRGTRHFPAFEVEAKDTTAAGDAFAGALAVAWSEFQDLDLAVRFANVAGALATTSPGAQTAMPRRHEIELVGLNERNP